jgi:hypothetical protein
MLFLQTQPQKAPRMTTAGRGREGIGEFSARRADLDNRATPALGEARQKRETSPRFPRPEANDGSAVGAGFVARTIPSADNRNWEERPCTKRRSPS